jgi:DEAD/DEAH box helicase domain-containing protein
MIPFTLAEDVRATILDYLETTFGFREPEVQEALWRLLEDPKDGLFKGPYIRLRLPFRVVSKNESPLSIPLEHDPYRHQVQAYRRLSTLAGKAPLPTLVTTGTGSGKTECFFHPIIDHCVNELAAGRSGGIKAIVLYPMNALAADQAQRMAEERHRLIEAGVPGAEQLRIGMYVGGDGAHGSMSSGHVIDRKEILRRQPPDILLTNFKMLDFLLYRPDDDLLWRGTPPGTLRYLVLDELHTYDGAQGTDIACLLRRLIDRLGVSPLDICPVGTSATLGGEGGSDKLRQFAKRLFGRPFDADSIITEELQTAEEYLGHEVHHFSVPVGDPGLLHEIQDEQIDYVAKQIALWLPADEEGTSLTVDDPVGLGRALAGHSFLRLLLSVLEDRPRSVAELIRPLGKVLGEIGEGDSALGAVENLLSSFLALVSWARAKGARPFLTVQVQLWFRELRKMTRQLIGVQPTFTWQDQRRAGPRYLPPIYCRECGASGWATWKDPATMKLTFDHQKIGRNMMTNSGHLRFLFEPVESCSPTHKFNFATGSLSQHHPNESLDDPTYMAVVVSDAARSSAKGAGGTKSRLQCPFCGSDGEITYVASQGASLCSVALSHLFLSGFNEDRKLLAFTDSVQDSSHRASFFGARTFTFNFRTALQGLVETGVADKEGKLNRPVRLALVGNLLLEKVLAGGTTPAARRKALGTLWPVDLELLPDWPLLFPHGPTTRDDAALDETDWKRIRRELAKRLTFEAQLEYGLFHRLGRTLEKTGSSTVRVETSCLNDALKRIGQMVAEEFSVSLYPEYDSTAVTHFVRGLLYRLRVRGALFHPYLKRYAEERCSTYFVSKRRNPWGRAFAGGRRPRYLSSEVSPGDHDGFRAETTPRSWMRDWLFRTVVWLPMHSVEDLFRKVLHILEDEEVVTHVELSGGERAYALNPANLELTPDPARLECPNCGNTIAVDRDEAESWVGCRCPSYKCAGFLTRSEREVQAYYRRIYASERLYRIRSREHSGILSRESREKVERAFKMVPPGAISPNLLVCTPTMEMGIDVGDLSAVMACSVPPTTANYLQRIGRAGRKTGNSLVLTLAPSITRGQYFFSNPQWMIRGKVNAPGCFLDAPEVLRRQFLAYVFDRYTSEVGGEGFKLRAIRFVMESVLAGHSWPMTALTWYRDQMPALLQDFLSIFGEELGKETVSRLVEFGEPETIYADVLDAFKRLHEDRNENKNRIRRLRKRIVEIQENSNLVDDPEYAIKELKGESRLLSRINQQMLGKYIPSHLTDEGLLPNYAFPEDGVLLASRIWGVEDPETHEKSAEVHEYVRGAASALREFAPGNTFYAEERKVRIDAVELSRVKETDLSTWRFCPNCDYNERESPNTLRTACPACKDAGWSDQARLVKLLRLRKVMANTAHEDALILDGEEERRQETYSVVDLYSIDSQGHLGAFTIESIPFGFERLSHVTLREVNFGGHNTPSDLRIADEQVPTRGFEICRGCGVVRRVAPASVETRHRRYCTFPEGDSDEKWEEVRLYREMMSEAIRILLPNVDIADAVRLHSFKAALLAGLRRKFEGDPIHLQMGIMRAPTQGQVVQSFLVLYDIVPGGTGFLSDIGKKEEFKELLDLAHDTLMHCRCAVTTDPEQDEGSRVMDGCHRCVLHYETRSEHQNVSRRAALDQISQILRRWQDLLPVADLGQISMDSSEQSVLELRFVAALKNLQGITLTETIYRGRQAYLIEVEGAETPSGVRKWRMVLQQQSTDFADFQEPNQPDFIFHELTPVSHGGDRIPPHLVAVFTDGYKFHVRPTDSHSEMTRDAFIRSQYHAWDRACAWSVTWKDVEELAAGRTDTGTSLFGLGRKVRGRDPWVMLGRLCKQAAGLPKHLPRLNSVLMLVDYLRRPYAEAWSRVGAMCALLARVPERKPREIWKEEIREVLPGAADEISGLLDSLTDDTLAGVIVKDGPLSFFVCASESALPKLDPKEIRMVLLIDDDQTLRSDRASYEFAWRSWLHAANLLQWLPGFFFGTMSAPNSLADTITARVLGGQPGQLTGVAIPTGRGSGVSKGLQMGTGEELATEQSLESHPMFEFLEEGSASTILRLHGESIKKRGEGISMPDPIEFSSGKGGVIAEVELFWPASRVCIVEKELLETLQRRAVLPERITFFAKEDLDARMEDVIDRIHAGPAN